MVEYVAPKLGENGFTCQHCAAYAQQVWYLLGLHDADRGVQAITNEFRVAVCQRCQRKSIWLGEEMVYPVARVALPPNPERPDDIKTDYLEAREVAARSPRGAVAILRLAIQKLCKHLGESGENINADIASLVKKGLDVRVQQALDIVRVTGNHAVHPGQIDLNDDPGRVQALFSIVNLVAERMIGEPKRVQELFDQLPESDKQAIAKRDAKPI